jgi:hypothetical protein
MLKDFRFGARMLRKEPGFTIVAVLTLALGIGAASAVFSLLKECCYRRLPIGSRTDSSSSIPRARIIERWRAPRAGLRCNG